MANETCWISGYDAIVTYRTMHKRPSADNASRSNVGHDDRRLADPSVGANVRAGHIVCYEWCKSSVAEALVLVTAV